MNRDWHQDIRDEAQVYCPEAERDLTAQMWQDACIKLMARCKRLDMALQSLTPGGSEYVGDPERCVARVREQMESYRKLWRDALNLRQ